MDDLTCGGDPMMTHVDEALVDGCELDCELDQYLPPGGQQPHYLYPNSTTSSHPLWVIHKPSNEDTSNETQESNNNQAKHKRCNETTHAALEYSYGNSNDPLALPPPPPLLRYHELQPSSTLVKTEREVYHQGAPTVTTSSPPPTLSYHQSLPLVPTPNYYSAGTGNSAMSATHGQYLQSLPSYQQYFQQRGASVFGNATDSAWSNYSYV
jgi:hypothetical protein